MIRLLHPEALLLLPVAVLLLRSRLWPRPLVGALRLLLLALLCLLLAQPFAPGPDDGRDIVLLVDRSRSMPDLRARTDELLRDLGSAMQPGDRVGVVAFARRTNVEQLPQAPPRSCAFDRDCGIDGTDLAAAIDAGMAMIAPGRQGSLLLLSDGEDTGGDPRGSARAALRQGIRIDTMLVRGRAGDAVAVLDLQAPGETAIGEVVPVSAWVWAAKAQTVGFELRRDGEPVATGEAELRAGRNLLQFRQVLTVPGVHDFLLQLQAAADQEPANDRGEVAVRATAPPRLLCVTPDGRSDRLTASLQASGLQVVVAAPATAPLQPNQLDGFAAVVLEDVAAGDLPSGALVALKRYVRDFGGGLLMTGGKASYGVGGYYKSAVEDVLPVTLELREEQRRFGLAMAIALDRSGSMAAPAGNVTKMDLADSGTASAVELLSPIDSVAVIAVDSAAHVVVGMTSARDKQQIAATARTIESMGGGIFIGAALHAAAEELAKASQQNKHIVLFADAADSEEPTDYQTFVPALVKAGVTVSVIGLGSATDSDAALLEEIARLGKGRSQFVADPTDLPRVFAQETIQVAKSAMVEEPCAVRTLAGIVGIGALQGVQFPQVGGYSLAWARPQAEVGLLTVDEQRAPLLTFWQCGLGRSAAFLGEVDGPLSGGLADWPGFGDFFVTLGRWLAGSAGSAQIFGEFRRDGDVGIVHIEVDPAQVPLLDRTRGVVVTPDGQSRDLVFTRRGAATLEARVPLAHDGVYRAAVQVGDATLRLAPVCLPYSPEFAPITDVRAGERLLGELAATTGGSVDPTVAQILAGERHATGMADISWMFAVLAVVILLAEIAVRRLDLQLPMPRRRLSRSRTVAAAKSAPTAPAAVTPTSLAPPPRPPAKPPLIVPTPAPPGSQSSPPADGILSALERARRRSQR